MGLEAGWNCHICLRSEHSTDTGAAVLPCAGDVSQGYASVLGSVRIDDDDASSSSTSVQQQQQLMSDAERRLMQSGRRCVAVWHRQRVRCSSAPDVIVIHSTATEPQRKSLTSETRHHGRDLATPSCELIDSEHLDRQMSLLLPVTRDEFATSRLRRVSERSLSTSERRRRSYSERSASVSITGSQPRLHSTGRPISTGEAQQPRLLNTGRPISTGEAQQPRLLSTGRPMNAADQLHSALTDDEHERKMGLLMEDTAEKLNIDVTVANDDDGDDDDDDDGSAGSYALSRRSSYTDSLPPGLGNRVGALAQLLHSVLLVSIHLHPSAVNSGSICSLVAVCAPAPDRPQPFPGQMSQMATKPDAICPVFYPRFPLTV